MVFDKKKIVQTKNQIVQTKKKIYKLKDKNQIDRKLLIGKYLLLQFLFQTNFNKFY